MPQKISTKCHKNYQRNATKTINEINSIIFKWQIMGDKVNYF